METNEPEVINRIIRRGAKRAAGRFLIEAGIQRLLQAQAIDLQMSTAAEAPAPYGIKRRAHKNKNTKAPAQPAAVPH